MTDRPYSIAERLAGRAGGAPDAPPAPLLPEPPPGGAPAPQQEFPVQEAPVPEGAPAQTPPDQRPAPFGLLLATSAAGMERLERQRFNELKASVQRLLVADPLVNLEAPESATELRLHIERHLTRVLADERLVLPRPDRARLAAAVAAELLAFGPIQPLLEDETVSEVMVNGPHDVRVERKGILERTDITFDDDAHVRRIIDRIVSPLGRRCDESSPMVDARLPDGSRVNAIIPPLSLIGPVVTIRKFSRRPLTVQDLVRFGTLSPEAAEFLAAAVRGQTNTLVSGGTGSGKTTLLNVLSSFIPANERVVTIEDAAELRLAQEHVVPLESRPPNVEGQGAVPIRQLLVNALRMRPDRIIVGECRGAEALDMLQAMNTGHDGSMTTLHANTPRDALSRLETMVLMAGTELPLRAIREQIRSAVQLILQQERLQDGSRRVTEIAEVQGIEGDVIILEPIFRFVRRGFEGRRVVGRLEPLGVRPKLTERLERLGQPLSGDLFVARVAA
jgi:pilus assembly protein CpaF